MYFNSFVPLHAPCMHVAWLPAVCTMWFAAGINNAVTCLLPAGNTPLLQY
jgi:hypothetical protein